MDISACPSFKREFWSLELDSNASMLCFVVSDVPVLLKWFDPTKCVWCIVSGRVYLSYVVGILCGWIKLWFCILQEDPQCSRLPPAVMKLGHWVERALNDIFFIEIDNLCYFCERKWLSYGMAGPLLKVWRNKSGIFTQDDFTSVLCGR